MSTSDLLRAHGRLGLTHVEVMTAIIVLAIGLLSLAAGSGWMIRSAHASEDRLGRIAALQAAVEEAQAVPFDALRSGSRSHGDFEVSWTLKVEEVNSALFEFVAVGPLQAGGAGIVPLRPRSTDADTLHYLSARR